MNFSYYHQPALVIAIAILWFLASYAVAHIALWVSDLPPSLLAFISIAPLTLVMLFFHCYDKWLWKKPFFNFLVWVPDLNGEYQGEVRYYWDEKEQSKACSMRIEQTASHLRATSTFHKEGESPSKSASKKAVISRDEFNNHSLLLYYTNQGSQLSGDTLEQHDGVNVLEVSEDGQRLEGYYFTNRNPQTKGTISLIKQPAKRT